MKNTPKTAQYEWQNIGVYGCWGLPDAHQDPDNPDSYIITWQRYAYRPAERQVMDVKFSTYKAKTKTFSPETYVFDTRDVAIIQGHPCWGYSHGKYRAFYCQKSDQGDFIAEVTADNWPDFQKYVVSDNEPVVTPDLHSRPHMVFQRVDDCTAWLFYITRPLQQPRLGYSIFDKDKGWDRMHHLIPTDTLVGPMNKGSDLGSALKEGDDVVLYASVDRGENACSAYRFNTSDEGETWTAAQLSVSGMDDAFKHRGLFVRVVKKGCTYYLSSQSRASHRWLARSDNGVDFELVADFGERRSLGNEMVNIEGTSDILLIYANDPGPDRDRTQTPRIGEQIECLVYDTGEDRSGERPEPIASP